MARSRRTAVTKGDMNTTLKHLVKNSSSRGKTRPGETTHRGLTHTPHLADSEYHKTKAARGGVHPPNSTDLLKMAHHGRTAKTPHGPGGMKSHQIKPPRVPKPKSGLKVVRKHGASYAIPKKVK